MARYLIVDDNLAFAENLAEILGDMGHSALVVERPADALKAIEAERFDAVISDMRMPQMSGAKLMHELRMVDPHLPAVVITAYTGDEDLQLARDEGLIGVLGKPVKPQELAETLSRARRGGLVALIEDDRILADNLTEVLRLRGFAVVAAHSVMQAERLGHLKPFAAIIDLRLPDGRDGEAMQRFVARFPHVPVIVITAHDDVTPPARHHLLIRKPFDSGKLLDELESLYTQERR